MSRRHRNGSAKLPKEARRLDHRRERHAAKAALLTTDPDALVVPRLRTAPPGAAAPSAVHAEPARRQWRHWKAPFWKRRNSERRRRNELLARLA